MLRFRTIDPENDAETVCRFRRDSFAVSFGHMYEFDEEDYLQWLRDMAARFPDGFVLAEEEGNPVGQLELSIREYEGKTIGYVNLYYLTPEYRGKRQGQELHGYAQRFFNRHEVEEYHLRVSPTNKPAIKFYRKIGMEEAGPEVGGKVVRMKGKLGN
ncbi:GNAT family N-acetyltransferase [Planococcus lenghuensis]|uniref:GNAT family N-acetyltransferase n=1 Tax=Planococcus lenghuensis TaxID=2213202 RepID=A0A1Q2L552_9BACL|nr:GNAT family N-acetyltransferase [Planococcus lenghuensis]AQQ55546.1 GNAT family N-acetyltransferase [Planococcus lenghuensis]